MKLRAAWVSCIAVAVLAGCGSGSDSPGNPAVYDRINSTSDCDALQREFDTAYANHQRAEAGSDLALAASGYMDAADERMKDLDCY